MQAATLNHGRSVRALACVGLLCDCSPNNVASSGYGSQLVAELFGCGGQMCNAVESMPVFVYGCAFVHIRLAPSQQSVNKSS